MGEIFSRVSSALRRGDQEEISQVNQKIQRKAGQWLQKTRNSMSWALDADEMEQQRELRQRQEDQSGEDMSREDDSFRSYKNKARNHGADKPCHRMKTEYVIRDGDKVCFTTRPVLSCGSTCQPQQTQEVEMDFHCLPRSSPFTQDLMNKAETQPLKQLINKRVDFRDTLTVPLACQA